MLTPPSSYRHICLLRDPEGQKEQASAAAARRRSDAFAAQLHAEREKTRTAKREKIELAQKERKAYIANMKSIFGMPDATNIDGDPHSTAPPQCTAVTIPPSGAVGNNSSDKASVHGAWLEEVSTAAPSAAGGDDDVSQLAGGEDEISIIDVGRGTTSARSSSPMGKPLQPDRVCEAQRGAGPPPFTMLARDRNCNEDKCIPAESQAIICTASRGYDSTKAGSGCKARPSSERKIQCAGDGGVPHTRDRRLDDGRRASSVQGRVSVSRVRPGLSLRQLAAEEEALQKSLLRLDFDEMKRQFAGQAPLWRGETQEETPAAEEFATTQKETQLRSSVERLNALICELRSRDEAREAKANRDDIGHPAANEAYEHVIHAPVASDARVPAPPPRRTASVEPVGRIGRGRGGSGSRLRTASQQACSRRNYNAPRDGSVHSDRKNEWAKPIGEVLGAKNPDSRSAFLAARGHVAALDARVAISAPAQGFAPGRRTNGGGRARGQPS